MKKRLLCLLSIACVVVCFNTCTITVEGKGTYQNRVGVAKILDETYQSRVGIAKILNAGATVEDMIPNYIEEIIAIEEEHIQTSQLPEINKAESILEEVTLCGNRWGITLSDYEIDLVAKITQLESGNQSDDGQQGVITVIFNRVASDLFPNSVESVLSQKNPVQFTTWKKLSKAAPTEKEYKNVQAVLNGSGNKNITDNNWLYFNGVGPSSAIKIGDHKFWR